MGSATTTQTSIGDTQTALPLTSRGHSVDPYLFTVGSRRGTSTRERPVVRRGPDHRALGPGLVDADDVQPEGAELVVEVSHPARFQEAVRLLRRGSAQGENVRLAKGQANRDLLPSARGAGPVREGQEGRDSRPVRPVEPEPAFGERREGAIRIGLELRHVLQRLEVRDAHVVQGEH